MEGSAKRSVGSRNEVSGQFSENIKQHCRGLFPWQTNFALSERRRMESWNYVGRVQCFIGH